MEKFIVHWRTSAAGIVAVLMALAGIVNDLSALQSVFEILQLPSQPEFQGHLAALTAGVGLIFAKDHNVTGGTVKQ